MKSIIEYNALAEQLESQLKRRGTLIKFRVLSFSEYIAKKYPNPFGDSAPPQTLAIEWYIEIGGGGWMSATLISVDIVRYSKDVTGFVVDNTLAQINHAIIHPEEMQELEIIDTIPSPSG